MDGQGAVVVVGDHVVGDELADRGGELGWFGEAVEQGAGDVVGGIPGQDPQDVTGQWGVGQVVEREVPDAGDGAFGVAALGTGGEHGGGPPGQHVQVVAGACAGLGAVRGGLLHGQGQVPEFLAHGCGAVGVAGARVGEDAGEQVDGFGRVEHAEADRGGLVVPAGRAAGGDQHPAARHAVQEWADVPGVLDVVQHEQPSIMAGEPGQRAFGLQLGGQPGQSGPQGSRQRGQPRVDRGLGVGGDPPPHLLGPTGRPARGERRLACSPQPVHRVHDDLAGPGERRLQRLQFVDAADKQAGPDVRHPARRSAVGDRRIRLRRQRVRGVDGYGVDQVSPGGIGPRGRRDARRRGEDVGFDRPLAALPGGHRPRCAVGSSMSWPAAFDPPDADTPGLGVGGGAEPTPVSRARGLRMSRPAAFDPPSAWTVADVDEERSNAATATQVATTPTTAPTTLAAAAAVLRSAAKSTTTNPTAAATPTTARTTRHALRQLVIPHGRSEDMIKSVPPQHHLESSPGPDRVERLRLRDGGHGARPGRRSAVGDRRARHRGRGRVRGRVRGTARGPLGGHDVT